MSESTNFVWASQPLEVSLLAHTQRQDDFFLDLDLHGSLPEKFSLSLSVFGENFEAVRSRIRFRLVG